MAFDVYVYFEPAGKIDGATTDSEFKSNKAFEIYSFSFGASNPTTIGSHSSGAGAGKVSLSSFNFMKKTDAASPALFKACASGLHLDKMHVILRKAGGDKPLKFLTYVFETVFVESVQWSGSSGGDDTPAESVSIAYGKVTISYQPQDEKGAAQGGAITGSWNMITNKDA